MSIDTTAMDYADDTFGRSMRALNSMALADLPPELDQDARDIARIILDHGKDYVGTEYCDMTAPLLESLARLVQAAKAADRLAALEAELASLRTDRDGAAEACRMLQEDKARLEQDNARLRGQISAMLGELEDFAMQNDLPIEDGHGYFGTGLPLRALQEWLFKQKDALAAGGDQ